MRYALVVVLLALAIPVWAQTSNALHDPCVLAGRTQIEILTCQVKALQQRQEVLERDIEGLYPEEAYVWTRDAGPVEMNTTSMTINAPDTLVAGPVTFSKDMTPDQAARAFWEAVSKYAGLTECHQKP